jgi:cytochrome oxidase Cu insertion factor (SCO1/SenC/PrrC family)
MRKLILGGLVILASAWTAGCAKEDQAARRKDPAAGASHPPEALAIGKVAPDIVGEDIDGKEFKLSEYRGKVVVLDFWGNW